MDNYKTIFYGILRQTTALSTGGPSPHDHVDSHIALDGLGRPTIRGTGLIGALIAQAKKRYRQIPIVVSAGTPGEQPNSKPTDPRMHESVWIGHHAHPVEKNGETWQLTNNWRSEIRDGVGIRQDTGATAQGAKFDIEVLPRGTHWWFCLEVDDYRDEPCPSAAAIAAHTLKDWQELCLLGRNVARGLGWMVLEEVKVVKLLAEDALQWPDATQQPITQLQNGMFTTVSLDDYIREFTKAFTPDKVWYHTLAKGRIQINGNEPDSYGLDTLSIGGSAKNSDVEFWQTNHSRVSVPRGMKEDAYFKGLSPDHPICWSRIDGSCQPIIPGSTLRGPLRHTLSWLLRKEGTTIWDPNRNGSPPAVLELPDDTVLPTFGSTKSAARLLISDGHLEDSEEGWQLAVFEQHAEDEFTQGVYGSSKFNRVTLMSGSFEFNYLLEADSEDELVKMQQLLGRAFKLGEQRFLPIGGAVFRAHGWVKWTAIS